MALFQHAVLKKYLSGISETDTDTAWQRYTAHFHNPEIRENIRNSKEEEYQDGFLTDLFVNVLGYTLSFLLSMRSEVNVHTDCKAIDVICFNFINTGKPTCTKFNKRF